MQIRDCKTLRSTLYQSEALCNGDLRDELLFYIQHTDGRNAMKSAAEKKYDAGQRMQSKNTGGEKVNEGGSGGGPLRGGHCLRNIVRDYGSPLIFAGIIFCIMRIFLYEPFEVPTGSMKPTIAVGDYIFVSRFSYGYGDFLLSGLYIPIKFNLNRRIFGTPPQRGDIVVFRSRHKNDKQNYIKRLIGLPGDEIHFLRDVLYINGKPVKTYRDGEYAGCNDYDVHVVCNKFLEYLPNGKKYNVLSVDKDSDLKFPYTTPKYKIPSGYYFFVGDNRDFSKDSRFEDGIDIIPEGNLIGRAEFVYWNSEMSLREIIADLWHHKKILKRLY